VLSFFIIIVKMLETSSKEAENALSASAALGPAEDDEDKKFLF
jgi:hypothetical protein